MTGSNDYIHAGKKKCKSEFIIRSYVTYYDRISKRVSNKLSERITEDLQQDIFDKKYRVNKRIKTYDTIENQFIKYAIEIIVSKIESLQEIILKRIEGDSKAKKIPTGVLQSNFIVELGKKKEIVKI